MPWSSLLAVLEEAREIEREERAKIPVECPLDFTALVEVGDGILHCPWGCGYQYPRDHSPLH